MRETLEKVKQIERELAKRRVSRKLDYYNTGDKVHKKQVEFHRCLKRNRWVFGGNRSGKSECGAVECVYFARGNHPYRIVSGATSGWVVSLSQQVQRDVAQKKVLSYLRKEWIADISMLSGKKDSPERGIIDFIDVKNVFGGVSRIGFKSCDQGREKFQGTSLDYVWFDEEPPRDIYEECRMRVMDRRGDIFATMTPLKGLTWVYYDIYLNERGDDNINVISMEWADNPYLDGEEISAMSGILTAEEIASRRFGKFSSSSSLVYTEFDEGVHVIEPFPLPFDWQDTLSIDPGLNNPLSCHWYATDYDGNVYVIEEHYAAGKDVAYHADEIKRISTSLNWKRNSNGNIDALIDSAANQRTLASSKSVSELFYDNGINVNSRVDKDLFSGINRVKSFLKDANGKPRLFIFKNCVNLIREIKSYWWGEGDAPRKKDDHALDELRYYIMTKPVASAMQAVRKSDVLLEKERLMRKVSMQRKVGRLK